MTHPLRGLVHLPARVSCLVLIGLLFSACATPLVTDNPQQVNLSGRWQLVPELSDLPPEFAPNNDGARSTRERRDDHLGSLRAVVRARVMTIEQTGTSMGIDYDGFPYRDVSWGKRTRGTFEVSTGWEEDALHIRSKRGRMILSERYRLSTDKQQLTVTVRFRGGSQSGRAFTRTFARQPL